MKVWLKARVPSHMLVPTEEQEQNKSLFRRCGPRSHTSSHWSKRRTTGRASCFHDDWRRKKYPLVWSWKWTIKKTCCFIFALITETLTQVRVVSLAISSRNSRKHIFLKMAAFKQKCVAVLEMNHWRCINNVKHLWIPWTAIWIRIQWEVLDIPPRVNAWMSYTNVSFYTV